MTEAKICCLNRHTCAVHINDLEENFLYFYITYADVQYDKRKLLVNYRVLLFYGSLIESVSRTSVLHYFCSYLCISVIHRMFLLRYILVMPGLLFINGYNETTQHFALSAWDNG